MKSLLELCALGVMIIFFFWRFLLDIFLLIFVPKIKIIKGKIIRFKIKEFIGNMSPLSQNFLQDFNPYEEPVTIREYKIFLKDEINNNKFFVKISSESFQKLKQQKNPTSKNIFLFYFKEYLWGLHLDHFEVA